MDREQARAAVAGALRTIAPEADLATVDPAGDLADELDLDSMDLMELRSALHRDTGVELPDDGDLALNTLDGLLDHLTAGG